MGEILKSARSAIYSALAWIGVAVGAVSAISAITRIFDIGLAHFFADLVTFYRQLLSPLYDVFRRIPLPFEVSDTALDIAALYLVLLTMSLRAAVLPLRDRDFFDNVRMNDAEYFSETLAEAREPLSENTIYYRHNADGSYTHRTFRLRPAWLTISKAIALSIVLWPVVSAAPIRNLPLAKYVFKKGGKDLGPFIDFGNATVNKKHLRIARMRIDLFAQMVLLPVGVALFFVFAKFNPLELNQ